MRYRIAILLLLAVLPAMPMSIPAAAAPVPKSKYPTVYALVYVGNGTNDKANDKRIAEAAEQIRRYCHSDLVKNFHVQSVEGTAVLRVWYTNGTPEKQAEIINQAVVDRYLGLVPSRRRGLEEGLRSTKRMIQERENGRIDEKNLSFWAKEVMRRGEELRSLPYLLERAAAPKKHP